MLQLERPAISYETESALANYQAEIDDLPYPDQVDKAQKIWPQRKKNKPFEEVKAKLIEMCSGPLRCSYCEDSMADEIEHIWPKSFYPERTFSWENYLYVCGPCNGAKGNQWDLFVDEGNHLKRLSLERIAGDAVVAPPDGDPLFIDPTQEDPFDFLFLDLTMDDERLEFCPLDDDKDSYNYQIAQFTIDALKLNERADLSRARYTAFTNYRARIAEYVLGKQAGFARTKLDSMVKQLKKESHPTVWHSILRYYQNGWLPKVDPEFAAYFDKAPEALSWI